MREATHRHIVSIHVTLVAVAKFRRFLDTLSWNCSPAFVYHLCLFVVLLPTEVIHPKGFIA